MRASFNHIRHLTLCAAGSGAPFKAVDIFDAVSRLWSYANLSQARHSLAATSLPNHGLAFFAGGDGASSSRDLRVVAMHLCSVKWDLCGRIVKYWAHSHILNCVQLVRALPLMLWTYLTQLRVHGALPLSHRLDTGSQPHRCRITDLPFLLAAGVRHV